MSFKVLFFSLSIPCSAEPFVQTVKTRYVYIKFFLFRSTHLLKEPVNGIYSKVFLLAKLDLSIKCEISPVK